MARDGDAVVVPAGTNHNVINVSKKGTDEALCDLLSTEPPGQDSAQNQGRGRGGRKGKKLLIAMQ